MSSTVSNPAGVSRVSRAPRKRAKPPRSVAIPPPAWARAIVGDRFALFTARVADAVDLSPADLERQSFDAYATIAAQVVESRFPHAVRFWNHVPAINDPADAGRDVYMVFNAGRFRAFAELYGGPARFEQTIATASAVGHGGRDLIVQCLASATPGVSVNNPRQVAPYHYSQRFGPLPPCFSRATRLADPAGMLLVGGTASVRGEDSVHLADLASQMDETFLNLAALVSAAIDQKLSPRAKLSRWLGAFTDLRVYYSNGADAGAIEAAVRDAFRELRELEMLQADLCRPELLVEIEGIADLNLLQN